MNLRDLRYLVAVAQHRHFGKAAKACFVSQPTLSTQLRKLEEELGVQLFERNNKLVMITVQGKAIIEQAQIVLREVTILKEKAKLSSDPLSGSFKLGIIPTVCPYLLPQIMPVMGQALPKLEILLIEDKTDQLLASLNKGHIEAAILALPLPIDSHNLNCQILYREPFFLALPAQHKLTNKVEVTLEDINDELLLLLEDGHCLTDQVQEICNSISTKEKIDFRATSLETLRLMVAQGSGITLLPSLMMQQSQSLLNTNTAIIPFKDPAPSRDIAIFWRKQSAKNACCIKLGEMIENWAIAKPSLKSIRKNANQLV